MGGQANFPLLQWGKLVKFKWVAKPEGIVGLHDWKDSSLQASCYFSILDFLNANIYNGPLIVRNEQVNRDKIRTSFRFLMKNNRRIDSVFQYMQNESFVHL